MSEYCYTAVPMKGVLYCSSSPGAGRTAVIYNHSDSHWVSKQGGWKRSATGAVL